MKTFLSLFLFVSFLAPSSDWDNNLELAKEKAKAEHKLILLNFSGSDWCAPCIMLKKQVFSSPEFNSFASERLILLRADFPRLKKNKLPEEELKINESLADKYNPNGYFPFTVLIDANGKVLKSWNGFNGKKEEFLAEIIASSHE